MQSKAEDPSCSAVLLSTFVIKKKRCRVYFHKGTLIWETERPPYTRWTLPLTDVLTASYNNEEASNMQNQIPNKFNYKEIVRPAKSTSLQKKVPATPTSFVLYYAARGSKNKWSQHSVTMTHDDHRQVISWVKTIRNYIRNSFHRPRKILLFINPFGGKKKGLQIWKKRVQPLMDIADIETKVIITERPGHIRDTLLTSELDSYHAAVCIGGDGTFAELFNGLIARAARDQCIDLDDPNVLFPKPSLPVGIIPSGSTDTLAYTLHGTTDIETAALHIVFGDSTGLDLSSVHNDRSLLRLYASILSYGYLGDVIRDSEKFRWMGPQRYDYSGFKKIIANKGYEGEIALLSEAIHPASCMRCTKNCTRCVQQSHKGSTVEDVSKWLTVRGKFFMVNGANISCACSKSPMGFSPHCHIGDGCVDVILIKHTSLINNIRMLLRLSSKNKTLYDLPFVEVYRVREFTFRASYSLDERAPQGKGSNSSSELNHSAHSVWNCDGEIVDASNVKIRVHCQLLKVFTRGTQAKVPESSSCFCLF